MNGNNDAYDPQGLGDTGGQQEIIPYVPSYEPVQPHPYPVGTTSVPQQKQPIPVRRGTLKVMLSVIVVLLLAVGALVFMAFGSNKTAVIVAPPVATTSAAAVVPTDTAPSPSASPEASDSPTDAVATDTSVVDSPTDSAAPSAVFASVVGAQPLGSPVDGDVSTDDDVHISDVDYPNSVEFYCPNNGLLDWNVAGFKTFTTVFGVPDDARSATGITDSITFADQNGRKLYAAKVSIGQPAQIQFDLQGASRLIMSCDRQGTNDSTNNLIALGNPSLSTS